MVWNTCMYAVLYDASVDIILPINENQTSTNNQIIIYPNPSSNYINIKAKFKSKVYDLEMYDALGRKQLSLKMLQPNSTNLIENIDVRHLESGSYFLILKSNNEILNGAIQLY